MSLLAIILGSVDIALCLFLIIAVLFQHGKSAGLSGTISGGAETFFGKNKGRSIDAKLSAATTVIAIVFVILTVVLNVLALTNRL